MHRTSNNRKNHKITGLIKGHDYPRIQEMLDSGLEPDARPSGGLTLLMMAAHHSGDSRMCELLLAAGADVNAVALRNESALAFAALSGHKKAVRLLLNHGADPLVRPWGVDITTFTSFGGGGEPRTWVEIMVMLQDAIDSRLDGKSSLFLLWWNALITELALDMPLAQQAILGRQRFANAGPADREVLLDGLVAAIIGRRRSWKLAARIIEGRARDIDLGRIRLLVEAAFSGNCGESEWDLPALLRLLARQPNERVGGPLIVQSFVDHPAAVDVLRLESSEESWWPGFEASLRAEVNNTWWSAEQRAAILRVLSTAGRS